jgi:hypothetical protein
MKKTSQEKQEHLQKTTTIVNQLGEEYANWYGRRLEGVGRYVALGEYILEETESDQHHDKWLMEARESFLRWKKDQHIETGPSANRRAG